MIKLLIFIWGIVGAVVATPLHEASADVFSFRSAEIYPVAKLGEVLFLSKYVVVGDHTPDVNLFFGALTPFTRSLDGFINIVGGDFDKLAPFDSLGGKEKALPIATFEVVGEPDGQHSFIETPINPNMHVERRGVAAIAPQGPQGEPGIFSGARHLLIKPFQIHEGALDLSQFFGLSVGGNLGFFPQTESKEGQCAGNQCQGNRSAGHYDSPSDEAPFVRRFFVALLSILLCVLGTFFGLAALSKKRVVFGSALIVSGLLIAIIGMGLLVLTTFKWSWGWWL